ncbi:MAG: Ferrous iron transport protein B [bacterium ADurb.Bin429]|nr:MAG: Ferrous iron transport protein B [bacterium ADurb.Bin429]
MLHVVDAKNLQRMLPMTLQLLEAGLPVTLALNMLDESEALGFQFDVAELGRELGIPVRGTAGATGRGMTELRDALDAACRWDIGAPREAGGLCITYDARIEQAIGTITALIGRPAAIAERATALLLLQGDVEIEALVTERVSPVALEQVREIVAETAAQFAQPLNIVITLRRQAAANDIIARTMQAPVEQQRPKLEWLSRILMHPLAGLPVVALVLYFGIYKFVGMFGAGTLVGLLEENLFGGIINPWLTRLIEGWLSPLWSNLFVGDYGIFTLGITYAVAIVLPIVGLFFLVFSIMEDSGYLPRLAMLIDRIFKKIGLNGRAVIPLVLGFGCDTMATMTTRVLETRRERIIVTLLLALAIPCSAQSGVFLGMLSQVGPTALGIYFGVIVLIFLTVGLLAAKVLPGQQAQFYIELPPLRLPRLNNVLVKTYTRLEWYFIEVLPLFILASVLLWLGSLTLQGGQLAFVPHGGLFGLIERALDPLAALIGLPTTADVVNNPALKFTGGTILLSGFFRRDFGAAGLADLFADGLLSPVQVVVSAVTFTLFLPCIAQFLVMKKERGLRTALGMAAFVLVISFGAGALLRVVLLATGWMGR